MQDKEQFLIGKLNSKFIGDDGAVVGGTVYSADAFCEDVHFRRRWMSPYQIGRKAMLVNISDAVAMNAKPKYALVTLSLPGDFTNDAIEELLSGLNEVSAKWGCEIIGGDTVGGDKLNISITLISYSDDPLYRYGIQEGDLLAYTGSLGGSREDLVRLERGEAISENSRFLAPILRDEFIREARAYLHAGMDISDGLFCDTNKLLETNKYGYEILMNIDESIGLSGEEYEMLVAIDPISLNIIENMAIKTGTRLTVFAKVSKNKKRFPCSSHHFG